MEEKKKKRPETSAEVERRFAKLRHKRVEKLKPLFGEFAIDHVWDEMTDKEIDYYSGMSVPKEKSKDHPQSRDIKW